MYVVGGGAIIFMYAIEMTSGARNMALDLPEFLSSVVTAGYFCTFSYKNVDCFGIRCDETVQVCRNHVRHDASDKTMRRRLSLIFVLKLSGSTDVSTPRMTRVCMS